MNIACEIASYLAPTRRVVCYKKYKRDNNMYCIKVHNGVSMRDGLNNEMALFDGIKPVFCQTGCKTWVELWVDGAKIRTFEIMTTSGRSGCSLEVQDEFQDLVTTFMSLH